MRRPSAALTPPIFTAPTLYCLAVSRTAASFSGETETTHRAPRSPNSVHSAGGTPSTATSPILTLAPKLEEAKQDSARVTARPPSEMSWADATTPLEASATRQSMRRFSAARSMAGGSPATMAAMDLEYSEEEKEEVASGEWRVASDSEEEPSRKRIMSPGVRKAILR